MKLRMAENSLFAMLLRAPWWISALVCLVVGGLAAVIAPAAYVGFAVFAAFPFAIIACIAAWRQSRLPSAKRVDETLQSLRGMPWSGFGSVVEQRLRDQGYEVARLDAAGVDFEAVKAGRRTLVYGKRWKVAQTGVAPLRELQAAMRARDASEGLYLAAGEITQQARAFANQHGIRLLEGAGLVQWLALASRPKAAVAQAR